METMNPAGVGSGAGPDTYTVAAGDTLAWIAARWGVDVDQVADVNGIADPDLIFPGQVLVLPEPARPLTTEETDHGSL